MERRADGYRPPRPGRGLRSGSLLATLLLLAACTPALRRSPVPIDGPPIDSSIITSAEQTLAWRYRHRIDADLDGDGGTESVILVADVELAADGSPLWEDGHQWAAYVEAAESRTLVYSAFVPNGFSEAAISAPDGRNTRTLLIVERSSRHLRVLEIEYVKRGGARLLGEAYYSLEVWMPGFATIP